MQVLFNVLSAHQTLPTRHHIDKFTLIQKKHNTSLDSGCLLSCCVHSPRSQKLQHRCSYWISGRQCLRGKRHLTVIVSIISLIIIRKTNLCTISNCSLIYSLKIRSRQQIAWFKQPDADAEVEREDPVVSIENGPKTQCLLKIKFLWCGQFCVVICVSVRLVVVILLVDCTAASEATNCFFSFPEKVHF